MNDSGHTRPLLLPLSMSKGSSITGRETMNARSYQVLWVGVDPSISPFLPCKRPGLAATTPPVSPEDPFLGH